MIGLSEIIFGFIILLFSIVGFFIITGDSAVIGKIIKSFLIGIFVPILIMIGIVIFAAKTESPKSGNFEGYFSLLGVVLCFTPVMLLLFSFILKKEEPATAKGYLFAGIIYLIPAGYIIYDIWKDWYYGYA